MKNGLIIDFNSVAAYLAHEDSQVQAAFLDTFTKELEACCQTRHHAEIQMASIQQDAKPATVEAFKMFTYEDLK